MFGELVQKLTAKGVHVSVRRYRVVCAQTGGEWGIGGPSVWAMFHAGRWIVATWTPRVYMFSEGVPIDLVAAAISEIVMLNRNDRLYAVDPDLQAKYGLSEVDAGTFLEEDDLPEELD